MTLHSVLALVFTFVCFWEVTHAESAQRTRSLTSPKNFKVLEKPESVEAVMLDGNDHPKTRTKPSMLSSENAKLSSRILLSDDSYLWDIMKPCAPRWGGRLIFKRNGKAVTVDLCFECNIL